MSDPNTIAMIKDNLIQQLLSYVSSRRGDVARGAETPELAALIVEKYAVGVTASLRIFEFPFDEYQNTADELCRDIDPDFEQNRKSRWAARPASIAKMVLLIDSRSEKPLPPVNSQD